MPALSYGWFSRILVYVALNLHTLVVILLPEANPFMKKFLRNNSLSIVFVVMFLVTWLAGQTIAGLNVYNEEQRNHSEPESGLVAYLSTPHFFEATFENWESEFLQMFLFVVLTSFLFQKGSAESKDPDQKESVDEDPERLRGKQNAPWPVRKGGWALKLYQYSLGLTFLVLFLLTFWFHAVSGAQEYNEDQRQHGNNESATAMQYMTQSRFWFESFQNWQSEFLSVGAMVVLSIYLRHKGSPESKRVAAPHDETGK